MNASIIAQSNEIDFHNRLIAIVDDDEIFRSYITILLMQTGARIRALACSDELLELIEREMPCCIILDHRLAPENGIYVFKRLRARYPDLPPVIMLSADESQTTAVKAFRNGFDDYLQKRNLQSGEIEQAIQRALANHQTSRCGAPAHDTPKFSSARMDLINNIIPCEEIGNIFMQVEEIADRNARDVGALVIRLSQWEQILFRFGKKSADDAMTHFADRLKAALLPNEICGRLTDNTLCCILVSDVDAAHLRLRAEALQSALSFTLPIYSVRYEVTPEIVGTIRSPGGKDLADVFRQLPPFARNDDDRRSAPKTQENVIPAERHHVSVSSGFRG
ncbi:two-component system cell cycle response regulator [Rhodoblastus acidophilus]|uniref:response regulator n=1 Tax=Rhodoblastus acidophilus TaxID=1074 RepID=UPI002224B46A|nr:response regulator [Rhodoblastus acidophilus]MCW2318754.1 two-component system cell cycle response regulator [Rhodoblastus acidophilus]